MKTTRHLALAAALLALTSAAAAFALQRPAPRSDEDVLFEAARKRLRLKSLKVGAQDLSKDLGQTEDAATRRAYIATFTETIAREHLRRDPQAGERATAKLMSAQPRIYRITFRDEAQDTQEVVVLARDTRACAKAPETLVAKDAKELERALCVDAVLENPGDLVLGRELQVETVDVGRAGEWTETAESWDQLVFESVREEAVKAILAEYRAKGSVRLQ